MNDEPKKVRLEQEACRCGIPDFYKNVAAALGAKPDGMTFDCTKICVSQSVQDAIFAYYEEDRQWAPVDVGMTWAIYGPKTTLADSGYVAEVTKDFMIKDSHSRGKA